jgi:hypothetical protein
MVLPCRVCLLCCTIPAMRHSQMSLEQSPAAHGRQQQRVAANVGAAGKVPHAAGARG